MQLTVGAIASRGILAILIVLLSACERAKQSDTTPTAPGDIAPTPTGLAEAYFRVVKGVVGQDVCPATKAPNPSAWHVEFDPSTPLTADNKVNITFEVDKGPIDAATDTKLPSVVIRSSKLSWPGPSGKVRLFCEHELVGSPPHLIRYRPVGICAGFADNCSAVTADFVDPFDLLVEKGTLRELFAHPFRIDFRHFVNDGTPVWSIPAAGYVDSYRRMRTLLTRSVSQKRDISIENLLGTFEALGDPSARKKLSERGSLKFTNAFLVSAAPKRLEAIVADVVLKQNVTFALPATVRIDASQPKLDVLLFKFLDRPLVIFESLPAAFGDLRRFEVTAIRLMEYESEIYLKDPFSDRSMILRSIYRAHPLAVTRSEAAEEFSWIR